MEFYQAIKIYEIRAAEMAYCSLRGPVFNSQHLSLVAHNCLCEPPEFQGAQTSSSSLHDTYTQQAYTHIQPHINKKYFKIKIKL